MKKQIKQLVAVLVLIVCALAALLILRSHNKAEEKKEEEESAEIVLDELAVSDITAFSYVLDSVTWSYEKTAQGWVCKNDESLELDTDKIESLLGNVSSIAASDRLTDVEDFAEYGLDEPSDTVTITTSDATMTYEIGDYNSIVYGYYVRRNDENTVYIVSGSVATAFMHDAQEYVKEEEDDSADAESGSDAQGGAAPEIVTDTEE